MRLFALIPLLKDASCPFMLANNYLIAFILIYLMSKLDGSIGKIIGVLKKQEKAQDEILVLTRELIRDCSMAIKCIHNKEMKEAEDRIKNVDGLVRKLKGLDEDFEYLTLQAYQEYAEAKVLLAIIERREIPGYVELKIPFKAYLLGLLDCVGELRREMLEELKRGNKQDAEYYFESMSDVYEATLPVRFSNSLLPNFRRKQDVARVQVENARSELLR
jgi:translin